MRYELKSIGLWALLKVSFFLNLVVGFIYGLFNAFFMSLLLMFSASLPIPDMGLDPSEFSLAFLFFFFPIMCAIGGAVFLTLFCVLGGLVYNLVARLVGGFELDLAPVDQMAAVQPVSQPIVAHTAMSDQSSLAPPQRPVAPPPQPPRETPPSEEPPTDPSQGPA